MKILAWKGWVNLLTGGAEVTHSGHGIIPLGKHAPNLSERFVTQPTLGQNGVRDYDEVATSLIYKKFPIKQQYSTNSST
jgi:hypothetical protein